ncbi:MAG: restriction endonuclease [Deltaproteobacteria bacterium]|nr:restriction endonuclease [Deltaproteobacteria bacterium]
MAIPNYQLLMLPLLKFASDGNEHSFRDAVNAIAKQLNLTENDSSEKLQSGGGKFYHRVNWACTYLRKAALLSSNKRGFFQITERGIEVLNNSPEEINNHFLSQFDEFVQFRKGPQSKERNETISTLSEETQLAEETQTPEEAIEVAYLKIKQNLADEILETIKNCSPSFFEKLVVEVLVKMGYGGTREDAGKIIGKSGDEGIDGIINEDRLGLDVIYIQAKKWNNPVGRPEIHKFAGALQGQRARKGVFITTSTFTKEAQEFASRIESKIILIDGERLGQLMIDYNVGVNIASSYELKRIDSDYFNEEL